MADAKKCDICGKFYDYYQYVKLDNDMSMNGCKLRFAADNGMCWSSLDLCSDCMTKVHNLLIDIQNKKEKVDLT